MNLEQFEHLLALAEGETVDFKSNFYHSNNYSDLLKDVLSFANGHSKEKKHIVYGVKDRENAKELIGLESFVDQSTIDQLLFENIEPHLDIKLHSVMYIEKKFQVLEIRPDNRPYIMKKKYKDKINKGTMWIRRGATNDFVTRADLNRMYEVDNVELKILDGQLYATKSETGCVDLRCKISNYSNKPLTITWGCLEIYEDNQLLTSHRLYGTRDNIIGADYQLKLAPKDEIVNYFEFGFTSTQCFPLGIDPDGVTEKKLNLKVTFVDADDKEYVATYSGGFIFVKGKFLWKVQLKK
ncbi:MAG: ATP-binding protein [Solibacillus sp.]